MVCAPTQQHDATMEEQQQHAATSPLASRLSRQPLRINTAGLRPKRAAAIPVASPTASPSASPSTDAAVSLSATVASPSTTSPILSPSKRSPKLDSFDRLPGQRPSLPGFVKATLHQPGPSALLRSYTNPFSCVYALHSSQLMLPPSAFKAASFPFNSPSSLSSCAAEAVQLTGHYPNPSTALLSLSSFVSTAAAQTSAPAVAGAAAQVMPHRPREGETSRFGAMGMDALCPALLLRSAARAVWPPLRRGGDDEVA